MARHMPTITHRESQNKYGFIGNLRKPFTVLIWLASKAVPVSSGDATAGFVFYQTQDGFNFRSIDVLISEKTKGNYIFTNTFCCISSCKLEYYY